jgi:sulfatase maturation enzyme AslB (radical SAM superfamily)
MCPLYAPDAADSAKEFLKSYREDMPLDMARQLAADLARMGTVSVEFIGNGEPMLHRQFPAVVEAFRQQRLEVILYTNGSRLTRDTARTLVELGVRYLRISVNAGSAESHVAIQKARTGDFDRLLAGAAAVAEYRRRAGTPYPYMTYGYALMQNNYEEAHYAIGHAARSGIDSVYYKPLMQVSIATKYATKDSAAVEAALSAAGAEAKRLGVHTNLGIRERNPLERDFGKASAQVYSQIGCYWPWLHTQIDADGAVYGCCQCQNVLGNLNEQPFPEIWIGKAYEEYRRRCGKLPELGPIDNCECDQCVSAARNAFLHGLLHPFESTDLGNGRVGPLQKAADLVRMFRFKSV